MNRAVQRWKQWSACTALKLRPKSLLGVHASKSFEIESFAQWRHKIVGESLFAIQTEFWREFFHKFYQDGQSLVYSAHISNKMLLKAADSDTVHTKGLLGLSWFVDDVILAIN